MNSSSVKPFFVSFNCTILQLSTFEKGTNNFQPAKAVSLCPEVLCESLGQTNSMPLDVVSHFLLTGLATAQEFAGVWEKASVKGRKEVCIYLCWWGMISTLIYLQTSSLWAVEPSGQCVSYQGSGMMFGEYLCR